MSTEGAEEEAGGRAGWGLDISYEVETGEGGDPPSPPDGGRAPFLRNVALPVSPSSHLTVLTLTAFAPRTFGARTPAVPAVVPPYGDSPTVHCTGFFLYFSCVVASTRNPSGFSRSGSSHLTALTLRFFAPDGAHAPVLRT
ncbi:hypothetical protein Memar_0560 [Methanoculleus marisnigri JR1]|uniref:Uncharacterized protein n=1 Tax=Methanoculleus marisnigri (strain ATCC 35101 / DSM 1498 / JR1) TaxID=368407 RepID=A3CSZ3_METMJ|nr:hypothetical protein Memar_0560 [Methanoculleus marisnigri JR1]